MRKKYKRTAIGAKDGDNIKIKYAINGKKDLRLAGVYAPELRTRAGYIAKKKLNSIVKGEKITVEKVGQSYGRPVVKAKVGRKSVNKAMRDAGYR